MSEIEFPVSRIVKEIKKHTGDKQVSLKVKLATEKFLQDVTELVSKELEKTTKVNKTITEKELIRCIRPYRSAMQMDQEHDEIVNSLQNIHVRMDKLVKEFKQKFDMKDEQNTAIWQ